ncbi:murein biosynthesis integral membrane protein MurJ [Aminiphilus circumscriptus]|uniref:murein biosynthesis integral membrane protein MurJ n=1 Tax=Aminiphilus circumscriptus TaxID=290732 RepID=UPI0004922EAD|nr:murein biosynthesis integral membrane protein MurJ [Aminiphilus circumscriptus]
MDGSSRNARMVRHAFTMMLGTFASRILGLIREVLMAACFGATRQLDAFYVAYTLANLSRQLLAEGALSASFVPVFSQVLARDGKERAVHLARQAMTVLLLLGVAVVLGGIVAAPLLVRLMAPGFAPEIRALAESLTRSLFPFLLFVSLGALAMGVLNSLDSFFVPAVAPALSNVTFIAVVLLFVPSLGIRGLVAAVLLGGLAQLLLQWGWNWKLGVPLFPERPNRDDPELRRMLVLFLPYAVGLSLNQVNPLVSRMLGSFLEGGVISVLNYADRVLQLPLGLFVVALSQAVLPMLSRIAPGENEEFMEFYRDALRFALFVVFPVVLGTVACSREIVHVLFFRGAFDAWAWDATSGALSMYALGLPGMACTTVTMRALYARSRPRDALFVTASSVTVNLGASILLMSLFSYRGIALAASMAFTVSALVGYVRIRRFGGGACEGRNRLFSLEWGKPVGISLAFTTAMILLWKFLLPYPSTASLTLRLLWLGGVACMGGAVYALVTRRLQCREWEWVRSALRRRGVSESEVSRKNRP